MRRRFHTLDALRGVAAIAVMIGHSRTWLAPIVQPRQWLAVDLFFVLSGVVLSRVYEARFVEGLGVRQFMLQRYIRLYPLYLAGTLIGLVSAAATLAAGHGALTPAALAIAAVTGLLMLPSPTGRYVADIMPLNNPGWSLFFELAINLAYVACWRMLTTRVLAAVVVVSALAMAAYATTGIDSGGAHWADFGWGFVRVSFSFFAGVLIGRHFRAAPITTGWAWSLPILLVVILFTHPPGGGMTDLGLTLIGFPLLVMLGMTLEPRRHRLMATLGVISYPLYAVHQPVQFLGMRLMLALDLRVTAGAPFTGIGFALAMIVAAVLLDRYYDQPVREWLLKRIADRRARRSVATATAL